jgi:hypothetical protein
VNHGRIAFKPTVDLAPFRRIALLQFLLFDKQLEQTVGAGSSLELRVVKELSFFRLGGRAT